MIIIDEWHELVTAFSLDDPPLVRIPNASYIVNKHKLENTDEHDTCVADTGKADTEPT